MANTNMNGFFLITLQLAEITRLEGNGMSLTNPTIERNARQMYAKAAGIPFRSRPATYLKSLQFTFKDNNMLKEFNGRLEKFGRSTEYPFRKVEKPHLV